MLKLAINIVIVNGWPKATKIRPSMTMSSALLLKANTAGTSSLPGAFLTTRSPSYTSSAKGRAREMSTESRRKMGCRTRFRTVPSRVSTPAGRTGERMPITSTRPVT
ncbi:MAG: hypothetical protein ACE5M4_03935, partial [Anaerolineales bacterium]